MEENGNRGPSNAPGVYVHEETGAELTAQTEPQADAMVRMGYVLQTDSARPTRRRTAAPAEEAAVAQAEPENPGAEGNKKENK